MGKVAELYKLEDHIRECDNRFLGIIDRIDSIDTRLSRMEQLLLEIKATINPTGYLSKD